jgi:hypothetical protein
MLGWLRWFNPALGCFGMKIVPLTMGHWFVKPGGGLGCSRHQVGWYLARRGEWEGLPDDATALQRFASSHREEIDAAKERRA